VFKYKYIIFSNIFYELQIKNKLTPPPHSQRKKSYLHQDKYTSDDRIPKNSVAVRFVINFDHRSLHHWKRAAFGMVKLFT